MPPPSLPCPPLDTPLLTGRTVDLERVEVTRHAPGLWRAIGTDASLWDHIPPGPFDDEPAFAAWLESRAATAGQTLYAIIDKRGRNRVEAGLFLLLQINPDMGTTEMGLVYGPTLSRQVGGTEAVALLAGYVLGASGYRRLEWRCSPENRASSRAAARYGFTFEGLHRQTLWLKGRNWDTEYHAILDREWPALAARFAAWLAPENFDVEGRQIRPLGG